MSNVGLPSADHVTPHFNSAGWCCCSCEECTFRLSKACLCSDCACDLLDNIDVPDRHYPDPDRGDRE